MHSGCTRIFTTALVLLAGAALAAAQGAANPAAEHQALAQRYLQQKQPELAIPELRKVVALDPNDLDARANLGVLLFFQGDYAGAAPELRAAVEKKPDLAKIQALLGMSEERTGDLAAAQNDLQAAFPKLIERKIHTEAGLALVETDVALGQLDSAAVALGNLRAADPTNPQVLSTAFQVYTQLTSEALLDLAVAAPDSAELHFNMAENLAREGKEPEALAQYRAAIARNPYLPGLHERLAELLHNSQDPALRPQALAEYEAALKQNPRDEKALRGLAETDAASGSQQKAAEEYRQALALAPNDADAETGLAKLLLATGNKAQAAELLQRAIANDPTDIAAHYRLSTLYRQQGKAEDAARELTAYEHYKQLRSELEASFHQMRTTDDPGAAAQEGH